MCDFPFLASGIELRFWNNGGRLWFLLQKWVPVLPRAQRVDILGVAGHSVSYHDYWTVALQHKGSYRWQTNRGKTWFTNMVSVPTSSAPLWGHLLLLGFYKTRLHPPDNRIDGSPKTQHLIRKKSEWLWKKSLTWGNHTVIRKMNVGTGNTLFFY
jgi:hypothetical protein